MNAIRKPKITVTTSVNATIDHVWNIWTEPKHVTNWNSASPDWHTPSATNDLREGGRFTFRMEARDGSLGFDFGGTYDKVDLNKTIEYTMDDDRKVKVIFENQTGQIVVTETFEAEAENSLELQQTGWQAILDNFKKYAEETA